MKDRRPDLNSLAAVGKEPTATLAPGVEHLFREYHGLVFRTAYRITGNAADAEDVLQTVFVRLIGARGGERTLEKPESYLRRAAVNVALDVVRQRQPAGPPLEAVTPSGQPSVAGDDGVLREALRHALAALKPQWAEIFVLRFIEGWTNGEIAASLGISPVLVAVTVYRARLQMKSLLLARL
jgi:RNA polymerase sigma-70 factor, ECF subfamily